MVDGCCVGPQRKEVKKKAEGSVTVRGEDGEDGEGGAAGRGEEIGGREGCEVQQGQGLECLFWGPGTRGYCSRCSSQEHHGGGRWRVPVLPVNRLSDLFHPHAPSTHTHPPPTYRLFLRRVMIRPA